jgi:uncharacterized protein (DUF1778 family)
MAKRIHWLNLKITEAQKKLISRAAKATHSSVSDFVLRSVCYASEQALADQTIFFLDKKDYMSFQKGLESTMRYNPKLNKVLQEIAPVTKT